MSLSTLDLSKLSITKALEQVYNVQAPDTTTWLPLKDRPTYEIEAEFPYRIRYQKTTKKGTRWVQRSMCDSNGSIVVCVETGKPTTTHHHLLVMKQFVDNPEQHPFVVYINKCRHDNRLENMKYATKTDVVENQPLKRSSYKGIPQTYYDQLPDGAELIVNDRIKANTFYKIHTNAHPRLAPLILRAKTRIEGGAVQFLELYDNGKESCYRILVELKHKGYYFKSADGKQLWVNSANASKL